MSHARKRFVEDVTPVFFDKNALTDTKLAFIIIDNRGLNARWCLTPFLLSLPTAAYLGQRGLTPAEFPHTTAQCHLTILGEAVLFCLNHPSFRTLFRTLLRSDKRSPFWPRLLL